jgi:hypothetical protein
LIHVKNNGSRAAIAWSIVDKPHGNLVPRKNYDATARGRSVAATHFRGHPNAVSTIAAPEALMSPPAPVAQRRAVNSRRSADREELLEADPVEELDESPLHLDEALLVETGEKPARRFELQSQLAADFLARHPQYEFAR